MTSRTVYTSHASWYGPRKRDIAAEAYQQAVDDLKKEMRTASGVTEFVADSSDIHDVMRVVQDAKAKFESQSKKGAGARVWLEKLSCRVMHYGKVFDTLAQHHPEYVALAWGAVKFVLMGIIGHATLVEKLAQAFVAIGDVLPRADLSAELYQTDYMKDALSKLYAYIIMFLRLCVRWYSRSPLGRLWDAVKSPYELQYKDLIDQIKVSSDVVEQFANAGARAEIRDIRVIQDMHQARFTDFSTQFLKRLENTEMVMMELMRVATSSKAITEQVSVDVRGIGRGVYRIEFHQVVQSLAPHTLPGDALQKVQTFSRRDTDASMTLKDGNRIKNQIQTWVSAERSSLLIVRTALRAQKQARNVAANVVASLAAGSACVFWNLNVSSGSNGSHGIANIFKSLIYQILTLGNSLNLFDSFAEQLNSIKVLSNHTEAEWASLLGMLLTKIPSAFIVIEVENRYRLSQQDATRADRFTVMMQKIIDQTNEAGNRLKILLIAPSNTLGASTSESMNNKVVVTSLKAPAAVPPRLRHVARRMGSNSRTWRLQMPKM